MLGILLLLANSIVWGQQDTGSPPPPEQPQLVQTMDEHIAERCMRGLVGFRNVQLNCVTGVTGSLEQCEIMTQNPRVLRYSRTLRCAASSISMSHPDGSPAVGVPMSLIFFGNSWSVAQREASQP